MWCHLYVEPKWKWQCQPFSRVRLLATPWTVACQDPLSMGFSRQEYWSGQPFLSPADLPYPGIETGSPALQADSLLSEPPGKLNYDTNALIHSTETDLREHREQTCDHQGGRGMDWDFQVGRYKLLYIGGITTRSYYIALETIFKNL